MPVISNMSVYPIKSCGGSVVTSAHVLESGFFNDRRFVLVDDRGKFMTQRTFPAMATIKTNDVGEGYLRVSAPNMEPLYLQQLNFEGEKRQIELHEHEMAEALDLGHDIGAWFSEILRVKCSLTAIPNDTRTRQAKETGDPVHLNGQDARPIHLISQASLAALSKEVTSQHADIPTIPGDRFRANIWVEGNDIQPFDELLWKRVEIAGITFAVKPTRRCQITSVDQGTGVSHPKLQPFKTIAAASPNGEKAAFGIYLVPLQEGKIDVGDDVAVHV